MLPFEIIVLDDKPDNEPDRLTQDEEQKAAAAIAFMAAERRIEKVAEDYLRNKIDFAEMGVTTFPAYLEAKLAIIHQERIDDESLTLAQLAAKYPQETADVIVQIMLNRSTWRPFLPEKRVYILGTRNYYLHPAKESV